MTGTDFACTVIVVLASGFCMTGLLIIKSAFKRYLYGKHKSNSQI